ncbi:unnamed protein product [Anisakis simplex]|uniref:Secreted protein n=1 Tax=Anisakis simplex TaxID=6269 RepID=A0A0M3JZZ4_ANISI|nr:unnamed protein product [Anisakis simplex]
MRTYPLIVGNSTNVSDTLGIVIGLQQIRRVLKVGPFRFWSLNPKFAFWWPSIPRQDALVVFCERYPSQMMNPCIVFFHDSLTNASNNNDASVRREVSVEVQSDTTTVHYGCAAPPHQLG